MKTYAQDTSLTYSHILRYLNFHFLANFRNKLLFCRLTLWWGEINLIRRFSLVSSPDCSFHELPEHQVNFLLEGFFFTNTNKVNIPTGPLVLFFFPTFFSRSNPSGHSIVMTSSTNPRGLFTLSWGKKHEELQAHAVHEAFCARRDSQGVVQDHHFRQFHS